MNRTYSYKDSCITVEVEPLWTCALVRQFSLEEIYSCRVRIAHMLADILWESPQLFTSGTDALVAGLGEAMQLIDRMSLEQSHQS
jgi:hypothetical protein